MPAVVQACLVHAVRHPADASLSAFQQSFFPEKVSWSFNLTSEACAAGLGPRAQVESGRLAAVNLLVSAPATLLAWTAHPPPIPSADAWLPCGLPMPADIAAHVKAHHRLMAHWDRVLPGRVLHLHYADMVRDQVGLSLIHI